MRSPVAGLMAQVRNGNAVLSDDGRTPSEQLVLINEDARRTGSKVVAADRLTPLELLPLLSTHDLGQLLHCHAELPSTNDLAKQLAGEAP